jgi:hypothetical protein
MRHAIVLRSAGATVEEAECACGLRDRACIVEAHVECLTQKVVDFPDRVGRAHLPAPVPLFAYGPEALASCPICRDRIPSDWPLTGYTLDLAVLAHASHRLAEVHCTPEPAA